MKARYDNLDGLRVISCFCLIAMHIKANAEFNLPNTLHRFMISWTHFVLLFLMISGFGMFCGYYESFKNGNVNLDTFYAKRYKKIQPFFVTLILIDIILNRSLSHIIEGITEATLVFGLLPNNQLDVIGVSWTLGVIFLFYMLFPFVVYLFWDKKRAWITFTVSILISFLCPVYFFSSKFVIDDFTPRHNILYCMPFFLGGAIVYLHKETIKKTISSIRWLVLFVCIFLTAFTLYTPNSIKEIDFIMPKYLLLCTFWLMYAISVDSVILNNKCARYLSGISMEMYLSHMFIFRILEKTKLLYLFGHGIISFLITFLAVISGMILFIEIWKYIYTKLTQFVMGKMNIA